ncbi:Dabb domain-containing protein [Ceratobasidium sp. AG-Ba]|nr:Dabb domain-containing protein [Ceratobasidium sp. AG-Ba]
MIQHVVFWKIRPDLDKKEVEDAIKDALGSVPGPVKPMQFSPPRPGSNTHGWDFGFTAYFESPETLETYMKSDAHHKVVKEVINPRVVRE